MSQRSGASGGRRLNRRAWIILGAGLLIAVTSVVVLKSYRGRQNDVGFLREAERCLEQKQPNLALQYLNRYLALAPDDVEALDLKSKILAEEVRTPEQALDALKLHNQVLGRDPDGPKRQETRRRLLKFELEVGEKAATTVALARDFIKRGAKDAEAHRLLAEALERAGLAGDPKAYDEACREYAAAEAIEPGDVRGNERLALLYRDKLKEPEKALQVLDRLVATNQKSPQKLAASHLARARYFAIAGQLEPSSAEIDKAVAADPRGREVVLAAAESANQRGDTAAARKYLEAIPPEQRDDLVIKLIEGMIELNEQRPDAAIQSWRAGLVKVGGNNSELTWRLAQVLLDMGRTREAEPLIAQYRRIVGGEEPDVYYRYLTGFAALKDDHPSEAIQTLEALRFKVPKGLEPHLYDVLGKCYQRVGDTSKALAAYRLATKSNSKWVSPWVEIANLQGPENLDDAARILEEGLAVNPEEPKLLVNLALILWRQQAQVEAGKRSWARLEEVLARARKVAPNSVELALVDADYLAGINKSAEALQVLEKASKTNPKSTSLALARANLLQRLNRLPEAIALLDRAIAADPQASLIVPRASSLIAQGHVKEARTSLLDGLGRVPREQQPLLWKALGEFSQGQADYASARSAYGEWARLRPDSPEPRSALLALSMATGDDAAIRADVDAMKGIGGPQAPFWRMARVEELLRNRPGDPADKAKNAARFDEAARLIRELQTLQPHSPTPYMLEGRLEEKRDQVDKAIAAYEKALAQRGGRAALVPLMAVLVRERRDDEIARLRQDQVTIPAEVERLATVKAIEAGDKDRAEQLAAMMVRGNPQGLDARVWQAEVLNQLGKPKEAEAALRLLVRQRPGEAAPLVRLLMFQVGRNQLKEASETVEQIRSTVKSDRPELMWAQCYRVAGNRPRADACFRDALKRWPDDLAVLSAAITYYEQTGRRADAEATLRHVRKLDPALGWATRALALSLAGHANDRAAWDEALALIGPETRSDDTPDDRLTRAGVYGKGSDPKDRQKAIEILQGLAADAPNSATVHEQLARLLRASGQVDKAMPHAARAAGNNASPDAVLFYASLLLDAKSYDEADRQIQRLVAVNPNNPAVAELRARLLIAEGKEKEAGAVLEQSYGEIAKTPDALAVGEKMIGLLLRLKQPEAAERVAAKVGALGPKGACIQAMFLGGRGRHDAAAAKIEAASKAGDDLDAGNAALTLAYQSKNDPRWLAIADRLLARAAKSQPESTDVLQQQARVRYLQGRYDDQISLYHAIIDQKPADVSFLNEMAWTLSENLDRPKEGLERADEMLEKVGRQPNLLDTRGVILTRLGKLDEAIADLETAAKAIPTGPYLYHLARAYRLKGRQDDFQKTRAQAKDAGLRPEQLQPSELADWEQVMEK